MNKSQLVNLLSKFLSTHVEAKKSVELIFGAIADSLSKGEKVTISNFGTFYVKLSNPRKIILPKSGNKIISTPRRKVKFKPSRKLLQLINKKP